MAEVLMRSAQGAGEAESLPRLEPLMEQAENVCRAVHVKFEDYLKLFDKSVHEKIRESARRPGVTHVVCFECLDMWSSRLGKRDSMIVGTQQSFTIEKVLTTKFCRLGDLPSRFQYPVAYASVKDVAAPAAVEQVVKKSTKKPTKKKK